MCSSATLSEIENVVNTKVSGNELFTAFDVTLAVQDRLKKQGRFDANEHRHRHLKNDVHKIVESHVTSGAYSRSLRDVGAPTDAFVYHPVGGDPSAYVPLPRKDAPPKSNDPYTISIPSSTPSAPAASVSSADADNGDGLDVGREPDARGTVCVSSFVLRSVGFRPSDKAFVSKGTDPRGKTCLVVARQPVSTDPAATYTVDDYSNVRITKSVFDYAGLNSASYDFEADTDKVYVLPHASSVG